MLSCNGLVMFLTKGCRALSGRKVSIYRRPVDKNRLVSTFLEVIFRLMAADGYIPSPVFSVKTNNFSNPSF